MTDAIESAFRSLAPEGAAVSLRIENYREEMLAVQRGVAQPRLTRESRGAFVTVERDGGQGYAATSDLTRAGLARAIEEASGWAGLARHRMAPGVAGAGGHAPAMEAEYRGPEERPWSQVPLRQKREWLTQASEALKTHPAILDWSASFWAIDREQVLLRNDGGRIVQRFHYLLPRLSVTANDGGETQTRTFADSGMMQGGAEVLDRLGWFAAPARLADEVMALLHAPNCPEGAMDLVLAPDQMILQIHESIGHPLELDRILGDERNYAGTSFVTPDMFGSYRYGSELLNVTFAPDVPEEVASYGFDDAGTPATREFLIKDGILMRPLGGATSQRRANLPGVANERACSWNRPPIDRMANLNVEPGEGTRDNLIARVERGVYMETNRSWSIDDSRNKFQFGCEFARRIENGKLKEVVRNPNYRGISAKFWRSLKGVGGPQTVAVWGTPYCGKGEPNQAVRVGHASPTCLFGDVEVFGGH